MSAISPRQRLTISLDEVAEVLSISARSVRRLAATGELPTIRLGGRVVFAISDLEALVAANRAPAVTTNKKASRQQTR
jgi:excisionase family DNA binding protein